jgi:hypothetical protein
MNVDFLFARKFVQSLWQPNEENQLIMLQNFHVPADIRYEEVQGFLFLNTRGELAPLSPRHLVAALCFPRFEGSSKISTIKHVII